MRINTQASIRQPVLRTLAPACSARTSDPSHPQKWAALGCRVPSRGKPLPHIQCEPVAPSPAIFVAQKSFVNSVYAMILGPCYGHKLANLPTPGTTICHHEKLCQFRMIRIFGHYGQTSCFWFQGCLSRKNTLPFGGALVMLLSITVPR